MKAHRVAALFPLMSPAGLRELARDIRKQGLVEPILTYDGQLLNGRNRLAACKLARVEPKTIQWRGKRPTVAAVISCNMQRRYFSTAQRAMIAVKVERLFAAEAKKTTPTGLSHHIEAQSRAATALGVTARQVTAAKRLQKEAPVVAKLAAAGLVNMLQAKTLSRLEPHEQHSAARQLRKGEKARKVLGALRLQRKRALADAIRSAPCTPVRGCFEVIIVDPPWSYDQNVETSTTRVRGLVNYADMSVEQICALPVGRKAKRDAVLWLWTTNAFMRHAYQCLDAWSFVEKTILTWDKETMGCGRYLRNVTEHCVLAVRGNPLIDLRNQRTIIREKRGEHSAKPEAFYSLVDQLCPGSKLEMFARRKRKGYTAWGSEMDKLDARR